MPRHEDRRRSDRAGRAAAGAAAARRRQSGARSRPPASRRAARVLRSWRSRARSPAAAGAWRCCSRLAGLVAVPRTPGVRGAPHGIAPRCGRAQLETALEGGDRSFGATARADRRRSRGCRQFASVMARPDATARGDQGARSSVALPDALRLIARCWSRPGAGALATWRLDVRDGAATAGGSSRARR